MTVSWSWSLIKYFFSALVQAWQICIGIHLLQSKNYVRHLHLQATDKASTTTVTSSPKNLCKEPPSENTSSTTVRQLRSIQNVAVSSVCRPISTLIAERKQEKNHWITLHTYQVQKWLLTFFSSQLKLR